MSKIHENLEKSQKSIFEISVFASGYSTGALCSLLRPLEHSLACLDPLLPLRRGLNFEEVGGRGEQKLRKIRKSQNINFCKFAIFSFWLANLWKRRLKSPTALRGSF